VGLERVYLLLSEIRRALADARAQNKEPLAIALRADLHSELLNAFYPESLTVPFRLYDLPCVPADPDKPGRVRILTEADRAAAAGVASLAARGARAECRHWSHDVCRLSIRADMCPCARFEQPVEGEIRP